MKFLRYVLILAALPHLALSVEVKLSHEGSPLLPIIVSKHASNETHRLADELARALQTITGGKFAIEVNKAEGGIVIGTAADWPGFLPDPPKGKSPSLAREDYLLRSGENRLLLIGRTDLAVQDALWDLLYRMGFRQYLPGPKWEMWPHAPNLSVDVEAEESPDYYTRRLRVGSTTWPENRAAVEEWKRRNRMISGFSLSSGHVYQRIVSKHADFFNSTPGAYTGSEREPKLDASRPEVLDIVGQYVLEEMAAEPGRDSISMEPSDGGGWRTDSPLGSPSNQAVALANRAAQVLRESYPGTKVGIYAYNLHSPPPDIAVDPDVIAGVATAFIKGGTTAEALMQGWHEKGAEIGVREYLGISPWDFGLPGRARASDPDYIARTIPKFYELGARYWDSETTEAWGVHGLGYFLVARFLWDTGESANKDALMDEFFRLSFGASAEPMRQMFQTCLLKSRSSILSEDLIGRMYRLLNEALRRENRPEITARIADFVLYARYVELMFRYQNQKGAEKESTYREVLKLAQGNRGSFMFDRWTVFREIPGRTFRIKKSETADWMKSSLAQAREATHEDVIRMVQEGIRNNPVLDFQSASFSGDLVPYHSAGAPDRKAPAILLRGSNRIYLYNEKEKPEFEFIVQAGVIYGDRGSAELRLFSDQNPLLDEPVASAMVKPDKQSHRVVLSSPYSGGHRLEINDGSGGIRLQWPATQRAAFPASAEENTTVYGTYSLGFFVPEKTTLVGGYSGNRSGQIVSPSGEVVFDFSGTSGPGYFSVDVPKGEDGKWWVIRGMKGSKWLLTVPPYLARSPQELLIPQEVQPKGGVK